MDFHSLNRRQLQSLCKLNHIPANITNVAMADALKSLQTVVGIEEIVNTSCSEVLSRRAPCTSFRTMIRKKVKKLETESLLATASRGSRGVRRELTGEGNEFMKTPAVSGVRQKGSLASTRENTVKKETTVQRVYNTRRSARLTEKKCTESGVTEKDISRPVKIASFSEEVSVASEKSAGSDNAGFSSVETSLESNISSENTEDSVGEVSGENCDEGISKRKVEDICIEFEKLDVIEDGSDQSSMIEKVDCCVKRLDLEEKQKVEEKLIMSEPEVCEEISDQVDNSEPDSKDVTNLCENGDSEENMMLVDEKIDLCESLNMSVNENDSYLALAEHSGNLLCDKVLLDKNSEKKDCCGADAELEETQKVDDKFVPNEPEAFDEKSDQVDDIKLDSKSISNSCDNEDSEGNVMVGDGKIDSHETLNFSVEEHLAPEEHSDGFLGDEVLSGENRERVDVCDENVDLEEIQKVDDRFILNKPEAFERKKNHVDDIKPDLEGVTNPCENADSEENLAMVDEKIEPHETLNVSAKVLTEADGSNTDSISCDTENPSEPVASVSEMKDGTDFHEALNISIDEYSEHSDSLLCDKVLSEAEGSDADSISCDTDNSNDSLVSVSETKIEVLECNGYTNNNESPNEQSMLDNPTNHNVVTTMRAEPEGIEENISTNQGDEALVNPNKQERSNNFFFFVIF